MDGLRPSPREHTPWLPGRRGIVVAGQPTFGDAQP
jgi:hypothetical protein